jgi:hypothetical protein
MKGQIQEGYLALLELLLPAFILQHFELKGVRKESEMLHLDLEEANTHPEEFAGEKLLSKGFFPVITIQDFPIREYKVLMHIKRRRWLNENTGKVVYRDWTVVATGTRITSGFAAFLKEISRYNSH